MQKKKKSVIVTAFMATVLCLPGLADAGKLEPSTAPGPTMHTLEEIYLQNQQIRCLLGGGDPVTYYKDADGDGLGDPNDSFDSADCEAPDSYVTNSSDRDDSDPGIGADLEPATPPGPTMHSLDEIYKQQQTIKCLAGGGSWGYYYRDYDGDGYGDPNVTLEVCLPSEEYVIDGTDCDDTDALRSPGTCDIANNGIDENCDGTDSDATALRFVDQCNGTVQDSTTGLIWLKDAFCFSGEYWHIAIAAAASLADGQCGLEDGSVAGDWRLPTPSEWTAFVDTRFQNPALSNAAGTHKWSPGDAFYNVKFPAYYWSSTEYSNNPAWAWAVLMHTGEVVWGPKTFSNSVWPVRPGN